MTENLSFGEDFILKVGVIYQLENFSFEYVGRYSDPVPASFPNQETQLFNGNRYLIKSDSGSQEIKDSDGSGLISNVHFKVDGGDYTLVKKISQDKSAEGLIYRIERGTLSRTGDK